MNELLWPLPSNEILLRKVEEYLGCRDFIHIAPGNTELFCLAEYLPKIAEDVSLVRLFGEREIGCSLEYLRSKPAEYPESTGNMILRFTFEGKKFITIQFNHPDQDPWKLFIFCQADAAIKFPAVDKKLRGFQKEKHDAYIYDRRWISPGKLDYKNFVLPRRFGHQFETLVLPQLKAKTIYNHTLLYSPPGYGKTAFARYIANTLMDWTLILVSPNEIDKPCKICDAFEMASRYQPAILFFEDVDTIGRTREETSQNFNPFLGALLNTIDGLETYTNVYVFASTNNPSILDPALRRAGRFGIHLPFTYSREELVRIFNNYAGTNFSLEELSFITTMSPAQIRATAKFALAKNALEGVSVTVDLIRQLMKEIPKEEKLIVDFKAYSESSKEEGECKDEASGPKACSPAIESHAYVPLR